MQFSHFLESRTRLFGIKIKQKQSLYMPFSPRPFLPIIFYGQCKLSPKVADTESCTPKTLRKKDMPTISNLGLALIWI